MNCQASRQINELLKIIAEIFEGNDVRSFGKIALEV